MWDVRAGGRWGRKLPRETRACFQTMVYVSVRQWQVLTKGAEQLRLSPHVQRTSVTDALETFGCFL